MTTQEHRAVAHVVALIHDFGAAGLRHAIKYLTPTLVVKATAMHQWGRIPKRGRRAYSQTIIVTIGRPNYRERRYVRALKRAGVQFPCRKVQLRYRKVGA